MRREDVTLEVRNVDLERVGTITSKYLDLKAKIEHNGIGSWAITLPGAHPLVPVLSTPGSGIICSLYGDEHFSGMTDHPKRKRDRENPDGTFTFTGVTDTQLLADARAWPQPGNSNPGTQTATNDTRTGAAEDVMIAYVARNIGQLAPAARRGLLTSKLTTAVSLSRGAIVTKSPRFQNLMELLSEIATYANLGYRVIQRGDELVFEVLDVVDRTDLVRLDISNGTLTSEEIELSPPSITRAIVAGQGEGVDRMIIERTTPESVAAEAAWGRVIESFIDQRDSSELVALEQSGDEALLEGGFTATNVKVIPSDNQTMRYAIDWNAGDKITVIVNEQETAATVTAAALIVNASTCAAGAAIGDVSGFKPESALTKRVEDTERAVEKMQRTLEIGGTAAVDWLDITGKPATFAPSAHTHDDRYFTETELNGGVLDARYFTETEVTALIASVMTYIPKRYRSTWADTTALANATRALGTIVFEALPYETEVMLTAQVDASTSGTSVTPLYRWVFTPTWTLGAAGVVQQDSATGVRADSGTSRPVGVYSSAKITIPASTQLSLALGVFSNLVGGAIYASGAFATRYRV